MPSDNQTQPSVLPTAADVAAATALTTNATATALVANDISWMKKSLVNIEKTLGEIRSDFVPNSKFLEVEKNVNDHETRLRDVERSIWKAAGSASIITALIMAGISVLLKYI